jgi:hypothetical protein
MVHKKIWCGLLRIGAEIARAKLRFDPASEPAALEGLGGDAAGERQEDGQEDWGVGGKQSVKDVKEQSD